MSTQMKKNTMTKVTGSLIAGPASMVETLEGRRLCSASTALDASEFEAAAAGGGGAGKVQMQDFHFVSRVSKASPQLQIKLEDILVSNYSLTRAGGGTDGEAQPASSPAAAGKVSMQDIN